jgi:hypothetical protein
MELCELYPYFRGIHISIVFISFLSILMNLSFRNICFFWVASLLSFELSVQHYSFESLLLFVKVCVTYCFGGKCLEQASLLMKIRGKSFTRPTKKSKLGIKRCSSVWATRYSRVEKITSRGVAFLIHEEMRMGTRPQRELGYLQ